MRPQPTAQLRNLQLRKEIRSELLEYLQPHFVLSGQKDVSTGSRLRAKWGGPVLAPSLAMRWARRMAERERDAP